MARGQRGFTLIELLLGLAIGGILATVVVAAVGRKIVDDRKAIATAVEAGLQKEAVVIARYDVLPSQHGCDYGHSVAFQVKGLNAAGNEETKTVCCQGWFYGCEAK